MSFYALQFSFEQVSYAFVKQRSEFFWVWLKEVAFAFARKFWEQIKTK